MYGDYVSSFTTVKFWAAEFKRGRKSLGDDERSGRPNTATTDENIAKVSQICLGVILINYLQEGKTITGAYCASLLDKLQTEFAKKRPHLQKKKILFQQDNAPSPLTPQRFSWRKSTNYGLNP
ncbi:histone-lysine N-methyltransferase SETMAR [Trichonephila clavipes]|nr:histone-lysine N-methyltransferase SETMAR [Trichonephila clavipes]